MARCSSLRRSSAACGEKPTPAATGGQKDPFAITAGPALMQRLKLGEARETEVRETLRVPGRIEVTRPESRASARR